MLNLEEVRTAEKLFLLLHPFRYNFTCKIQLNSKHWEKASWITVSSGVNPRTNQSFNPRLTDKSILDVINGKLTSVHVGHKKYFDVEYIGVSFDENETQYCTIDIDNKPNKINPYYNIETLHKIIETTKDLGEPILMRSSDNLGWHLRWYFDKPVKTWMTASYLKDLLEKNGFTIKDGMLELYPNVKASYKSSYKPIRLPCQKDSAILSLDDGRAIAEWNEGPEIFLCHWKDEVTKHLIDTSKLKFLQERSFKNPDTQKWYKDYITLKDKGLTGPSQDNDASGLIIRGLITFEGYTKEEDLIRIGCSWIDEKHNGFSSDYNKDPKLAYEHIHRWVKWVFDHNYQPIGTNIKKIRKQNNWNRAKSAKYDCILEDYLRRGKINLTMNQSAISRITGIPRTVIQRKLPKLKSKTNHIHI